MVRVVIVGAVAHDDVGLPIADQARDCPAILERRRELAVVDVHDGRFDAEDPGALGHFRRSAASQRAAGLLEVTNVAVGHRHELHLVPLSRPQRRHSTGLELGIVWMRAEGDYSQRSRRA